MPLEIFNVEQGTDEWLRLRLGLPTASEFSSILAQGKGLTRASYLRRLAGELICGEPEETFKSPAMGRGNAMESQARAAYALMTDSEPELVGFVKNHGAGYSPDSFIGSDGQLEIKTNRPSVLIDILDRVTIPPEHVPQVQGGLWITERDWCDVVCFWPGMPMFICRAYRDYAKIGEIAREVARFREELDAMVARIKRAL